VEVHLENLLFLRLIIFYYIISGSSNLKDPAARFDITKGLLLLVRVYFPISGK
jgi:hypothetical protein